MTYRSHWIFISLAAAAIAPFPIGHAQTNQADLIRPTGATDLNNNLARLASNPRDVAALIGAGEAALSLDDPRAAAGFFARADAIESGNGRIKAGLGRVMVKLQNPAEALRLFDQAVRLRYPEADFLADRGLARDMTGDQAGAQKDYQTALARTPEDPELVRRYAASLGISGQIEASDRALQPLLYKSDRAAWRYRAFVLAMNNRQADAKKIVDQTLPAQIAAGLTPYMQKMPYLTAGQKAAAVHFGHFPTTIGTTIVAVTPTAPAPGAASTASVAVAQSQPTQVAARDTPTRSRDRTARQRAGAAARSSAPEAAASAMVQPIPAADATPVRVADARDRGRGRRGAAVPTSTRPTGETPAPSVATSPVVQPLPSTAQVAQAPRQPPTVQPVPAQPIQPTPSQVAPTQVAPARETPAQTAPAQPVPTTQTAPTQTAPTQAQAQAPTAATSPSPASRGATAVQGPPAPGFESMTPSASTPTNAIAQARPPAPAPAPNPEATRTLADIIKAIDVPESERRPTVAAVDLAEVQALQAARRAERQAAADKVKKAAAAKAKAEADAKAKAEAAEKARLAANPSRNWLQIATGASKSALSFTLNGLRKKYPDLAPQDAWIVSWGRTNRLVVGPFPSFARAQTLEKSLKADGADVFAWKSEAGEDVTRVK